MSDRLDVLAFAVVLLALRLLCAACARLGADLDGAPGRHVRAADGRAIDLEEVA